MSFFQLFNSSLSVPLRTRSSPDKDKPQKHPAPENSPHPGPPTRRKMKTELGSDEGPGEASQMPVQQDTDIKFESLYVEYTYIIEFADGLGVRVPIGVIERYPTFASHFVGHYLDISELDEAAARVLVHYLYTGEYQAPVPEAGSPDEKRYKVFALNLAVYFAGVAHDLEHLAVLASIELTKLGEDLTFIEILDIMEQEDYEIGEDEVWFARYMADRAQRWETVTEAQVQSFRARIGEKRTLVNILIESVLNLKLEVQRQKALLEDGWSLSWVPGGE